MGQHHITPDKPLHRLLARAVKSTSDGLPRPSRRNIRGISTALEGRRTGSSWWSQAHLCTWITFCGAALASWTARGADWPTYQHDIARTGQTAEQLSVPAHENWVFRSTVRPVAAWDEPAIWDGWHKIRGLKNRQVFDKAFHVAAVGDAVYFGSSVDDQVYCLDAQNGRVRWRFFTEGPVRLAPSIVGNRLYVGSDDGFVYCLERVTGQLIWRQRLGPTDRRIPGNGRIISPWAIRTGVLVLGNTAYACGGAIPSETIYVAALDAQTGQERWKTTMEDLPAQGYLLASNHRLYVTTGRSQPIMFDRQTGKRLRQVGGSGGTYALLSGDQLLYGPGKTGQLGLFGSDRDQLASFSGNHVIASHGTFYLHSDDALSAVDSGRYVTAFRKRQQLSEKRSELAKKLKEAKPPEVDSLKKEAADLALQIQELTDELKRCVKWNVACDSPYALCLAGNTLFAGGAGHVIGIDTSTGNEVWRGPVEGNAFGLAVANSRLYVSTDEGAIHCFAESDPPRIAGANVDTQRAAHRGGETQNGDDQPSGAVNDGSDSHQPGFDIHGPFLEFVAPETVRVSWYTDELTTSALEFGQRGAQPRRYADDQVKRTHEFKVTDVARDTVYQVKVGGNRAGGHVSMSPAYRFDSHFVYITFAESDKPSPYPADPNTRRYESIAQRMIQAAGTHRGYALVLGSTDGRLAYHLAQRSGMKIIVREDDIENVRRIRKKIDAAGLYGSRVVVHHGPLDALPYGPYLANLIVADTMLTTGDLPAPASGLAYSLRPDGGTMVFGQWAGVDSPARLSRQAIEAWWEVDGEDSYASRLDEEDGLFWICQRGPLVGAGEWTHQYADPDNAACSNDALLGSDLSVQWWGRPGARPMPDRGNRYPAPVSAGGRLYVQGNRVLFGMDAYNGTILWVKQIPTMRRANMPRDCSNMMATHDSLYVAIGSYCSVFDGVTGERKSDFRVPETASERPHDWGYLANVGPLLIGSGVKKGSHYLGDEGEWYEGSEKKDTARVSGDYLFVLDRHTGSQQWLYQGGSIIHSTITIADGTVFFIESRSEAAKASDTGRLLEEVQSDQHLVAIDLATGAVRWQRPCDFSQCHHMTYMLHGSDKLLVVGSDKKQQFHVHALDANTGTELWQHGAPDKKKHHTGFLAHPTIVGSRVYFNKHTYDLENGNVLDVHDFNWHGCGVMSASRQCLFSRYEYHGVYDLQTKTRTELLGIRGGCWLHLIPSGGLLLAPESGSGCSCAHAIQTSIAYVPSRVVALRKNGTPGVSAR